MLEAGSSLEYLESQLNHFGDEITAIEEKVDEGRTAVHSVRDLPRFINQLNAKLGADMYTMNERIGSVSQELQGVLKEVKDLRDYMDNISQRLQRLEE